MRRRALLVFSILALPPTGGCATCQADCGGPEIIVALVDPNAVSVEVCQLGQCERKDVASIGGAKSMWFPVMPEDDRRVRADVAVLGANGSTLVIETVDEQLPEGDCGCEFGPILLRANDRAISPT